MQPTNHPAFQVHGLQQRRPRITCLGHQVQEDDLQRRISSKSTHAEVASETCLLRSKISSTQPGEASRHRLGNEKASPALRLVAAGDNAHPPDMSRLHGLGNSNLDPVIGQPHKLLGGLHGQPCATTSTNFQPCVQTALTVVSTGKEEETLSRPWNIVVLCLSPRYTVIYKEEELGSWKGFASLHFIASQGEADPLLEKQNVGSVF
ncbi:hypothetical protein CSIM01_11194 [Colletotrichum simmondsii]|uniref:Uncharacterized protein n=1 Tax=Colletotrichum simmondsii TaxID=703756 RepID=A0A135SH56_9PEZI|nr:hypothetical protein CSIM01_11194 [Colletotrichum simmondsii]